MTHNLFSENETTGKDEVFPYILDSSLIMETFLEKKFKKNKSYNLKLVDLNGKTHVYIYEKKKIKKIEKDFDLNLKKQGTDYSAEDEKKKIKKIEKSNITRSKISCQRIAIANEEAWKSFITLTFSEEITLVNDATKRFKLFLRKVQRVMPDFKYICVTEFQKNGRVHYHLLTNVSVDNTSLVYIQEENGKIFYHIKYWLDGFTSFEPLKDGIKQVVGYISKYMTKEVDDRLFNHRRYRFSKNLIMPKESFIDLDSKQDLDYFKKNIQDKEITYHNHYLNSYDNTEITFLEYSD